VTSVSFLVASLKNEKEVVTYWSSIIPRFA